MATFDLLGGGHVGTLGDDARFARCHVCDRVFRTEAIRDAHLIEHPGRTPQEMVRGLKAQLLIVPAPAGAS